MQATVSSCEPASVVLANQDLVGRIGRLAQSYSYPHSIFGSPRAASYVERLAQQSQYPGEGWYASLFLGETAAFAYLSIYGIGNGRDHTLWKIRHPLLEEGQQPVSLRLLFEGMVKSAANLRPGTAKFIIFLSEHETNVIDQVQAAGFEREGCFRDYYRLGEACLVYGKTITKRNGLTYGGSS
jgi:hypothetical protein